KSKELATCQGQIKTFKLTEAQKDNAIEELRNAVNKLEERLRVTEDHLKQKNLEIKKLTDEKKCALATQYAAGATLKREENKIPEKIHRQKILEVEKLSQTIQELEETILESGATANAIRDYQWQIFELLVGIS
ncbi:hypothetical protein S83_055270, partial [Arachis hypogaea]